MNYQMNITGEEMEARLNKVPVNEQDISDIEAKLPEAATSENPLTDKAYVDSEVSDAKAEVIGDATTSGNTLGKAEDRIESLESAVGTGGSVDSRIDAAKAEIIGDATTSGNTLGKAEDRIESLESAVGTGGSVDTRISNAIDALDASVSQAAGADGLALSITEENGVVTSVSGSIAANTYDAHGAAATAKSELLGNAAADYNTLGKLEDKLQAQDAAIATIRNNNVVVVADHTAVTSPDSQTIYREPENATPPTYYIDWMYQDSTWKQIGQYSFPGIDDTPTPGSLNLVKSGGVAASIVYDISEANSGATYADLAAALDSGNNVPESIRKGGMSVKFVLTSDNKYVQYRLMKNTFSTTESDWQGVDEKPVDGSHNLIDSGGAFSLLTVLGDMLPSAEWVTYSYNFKQGKIYRIYNISADGAKLSGRGSLNGTSGNQDICEALVAGSYVDFTAANNYPYLRVRTDAGNKGIFLICETENISFNKLISNILSAISNNKYNLSELLNNLNSAIANLDSIQGDIIPTATWKSYICNLESGKDYRLYNVSPNGSTISARGSLNGTSGNQDICNGLSAGTYIQFTSNADYPYLLVRTENSKGAAFVVCETKNGTDGTLADVFENVFNKIQSNKEGINSLSSQVSSISSAIASLEIPSAIKSAINITFNRFNKWEAGKKKLVFPIVSDLHANYQSMEYAEVLKYACTCIADIFGCSFVANLGDMGIDQDGSPTTWGINDVYAMIDKYAGYQGDCKVPVLFVKGNHESYQNYFNKTGYPAISSSDYNNYICKEAFQMPMQRRFQQITIGDLVNYGYVDFDDVGIRIIFLDTDDNRSATENASGVTQEQINWLGTLVSSTPSEKDIIILEHRPINYHGLYKQDNYTRDPSNDDYVYNANKIIESLCKDYNNRRSGSLTQGSLSLSWDFTGIVTSKIIGVFCGHSHFNWYLKDDALNMYGTQGMGWSNPSTIIPSWGTYYTQTPLCIDLIAVCPSERKVKSFRIGGGDSAADLEFTY